MRGASAAFDRLKAEGVSDIAAYLDTHPELVEHAKDVIQVTAVNREAVSLLCGNSASDWNTMPKSRRCAGTPEMSSSPIRMRPALGSSLATSSTTPRPFLCARVRMRKDASTRPQRPIG